MDAILKTLSDLEGVNGAVVTDARGQVVAYRAHAVYDLPLLQQVGHATVTAIDSIKLLHEDWESISAQFSEGKLLIRNIARGKGPEYTLSVIADARLNVSFAGVAIRVAVGKLKTVLEAEAAAPLGMAVRPPIAAPAAAAPSGRGSIPDGVTNGLSWSEFGGSSGMSASGMNGVDAASSVVLAGCTKALARSVGPMAKRYVKEAVSMLWPDRPFSRDQLPVLVAELEKYLANPEDASQFRKTVAKISV
jgi:predicted regulator of Ras-like GTPase activity (Roadblock/LC7/MglB family)